MKTIFIMIKSFYAVMIILLFSFTLCEQNGFISSIQKIKEILFHSKINNSFTLIQNIQSSVIHEVGVISKEDLKGIRTMSRVPDYALQKFKAAIYAKEAEVTSFHFEIEKDKANLIEGIGKAIVKGNKVIFAYFEANTTGDLVQPKETVHYRKCKHVLLLKKCKTHTKIYDRPFNIEELDLIKNLLREQSGNALIERISNIRNNPYLNEYVKDLL